MPRYLIAFHGGRPPEIPADRTLFMNRWGAWVEKLGSAIVDQGSILGAALRVIDGAGVTQEAAAERMTGYYLLEAGDLKAAAQQMRGCPIFEVGGAIEVSELISMPTGASDHACN